MTASTPYISVNPMIVVQSCVTVKLDAARNVGNTPSIAQGCRPTSASIQPNSMAIHGKGMTQTAERMKKRQKAVSQVNLRNDAIQKATAKKAMKKKPRPAITRKTQNMTGTFGTVDHAACWTCSGVAARGSATKRVSSMA